MTHTPKTTRTGTRLEVVNTPPQPESDPVLTIASKMVMAALRDDLDALEATWDAMNTTAERERETSGGCPNCFRSHVFTCLAYIAADALLAASGGCGSSARDMVLDHYNNAAGGRA